MYRGAADRDGNDHSTHVDHLRQGGRLLSQDDEQALAAAIPGSQLVVYDDTGHLVLWEQPERVANDLTDFVAGLSA